jgi:Mor family transcriptional regulator
MTNEFKHKSYELGMTITAENVDDAIHVELSKLYTQALAQSMTITKQNLTANIINNVWGNNKPYEIEVDFDE